MKISSESFILVADGRKALLLRNAGKALAPKLQVQEVLEAPPNPATREQGTERPGRSVTVDRPSAFEQTDWHARAEESFADEIARMLERAGRTAALESLVLVAPPRMLASLRRRLPNGLKRSVVAEIHKDLTKQPVGEIERLLTA